MTSLFDRPIVPAQAIYREAQVSRTRGDRVLTRLAGEGLISPTKTPTGRTNLSPKDGERLFAELTAA